MNEEKEKDLRHLNLIIHNLVEPTQEDGLARKQADIKKVSKVIHDYLGVSTTVNNAIRLGKRVQSYTCLKSQLTPLRIKLLYYVGALLYVVTRTLKILSKFISPLT